MIEQAKSMAEIVSAFLIVIAPIAVWMDKRSQKREKKNEQLASLFLYAISVIGELSLQTAKDLKAGSTNGELSKAMDNYDKFKSKMAEFKNQEVSKGL